MKNLVENGFGIKMEFSPELFIEKGQHSSFYEDAGANERVPASGLFRIQPQSAPK